MSRVTKSDITLDMECWVEELSAAQLAAYERVANEHNAVKSALKNALTANEGKELFNGQVFQAYSFKGKVLQEIKEATLPKKPPKTTEPSTATSTSGRGRKRSSNIAYLESSDEADDDMPLAKRIALKKEPTATMTKSKTIKKSSIVASNSTTVAVTGKASPQTIKSGIKGAAKNLSIGKHKDGASVDSTAENVRPSEMNAVGGLIVGSGDKKDGKDSKENNKEAKMQGKTYPSLVVLAKPYLKVKDMAATRNKLDSKVKLVLMLTPNKFCEWLIQEGLLRSAQNCVNHRNHELKLGVYSDASRFPFTGGYVWVSECCLGRFVSVFHNSIFEGAQHPPSCILKLIYHWACQTSIQNVVQWVKVDSVYIKGIYTWLRAICTLSVHQKCKKLGGLDKFVEVGVISLGTTSQDGQQRQVKVEVLGVYDYAEKLIRLRAVEPIVDGDRNYKKRFQTILEPLSRWVHKDSTVCIDLTVDKITLYTMGFKNIVQAAATDTNARHNNAAVMEYLRRIVPRMFQNTLSLLSRQMIQQFLDELVWREHFGTYALQAFNNITAHIAEQTRFVANETLTQRLYQVATNPFKDWSVLPSHYKETPANHTPKRLKKPINDADYLNVGKEPITKNIKKEIKEAVRDSPTPVTGRRRGVPIIEEDSRIEKKNVTKQNTASKQQHTSVKTITSKAGTIASIPKSSTVKKPVTESKAIVPIKKEEDDLKGLEELYYGVCDGFDEYFESFPFKPEPHEKNIDESIIVKTLKCTICYNGESFDSNEKLQTHLVSHISPDGKEHQFQCLFCLEKHQSEELFSKHNLIMHPLETKTDSSPSYHCLICQQRHNSLSALTLHLQKVHNLLELPYWCQACGYRSSSHRDLVRHFYDDHKNQNFLQCPYCLDIFPFCQNGDLNARRIEFYFLHLQQHLNKKDSSLRCQKCALSFIKKGVLKQHLAHHHISMTKSPKTVRLLLNNSLLIPPPKVRTHHREALPYTTHKLGPIKGYFPGYICAECSGAVVCVDKHFVGLLKCNKCSFKCCCERNMFQHATVCNGNAFMDGMTITLPDEMHCICGFATANGNKMAHHMATCGQKSCYPSVEIAHENTVKRNMLDMLGLVRRDGETGEVATVDESGVIIEESELENHHLQQQQPDQEQQPDQQEQLDQHHSVQQPQSEHQHQQAHYEDMQTQVANDANVDVSVAVLAQNTGIDVQQEPIQFGEMEATPVMLETDQQQTHGELQWQNATAEATSVIEDQQHQQQQPQYSISFGQTEVQTHALNAADIDMPLIGDLADPNPPPTPQFLGEVHTPMFDAVAAAEQQHYHQMMQQQHHQQHSQ